jgi:hypothetical protein
MKKDHNKAHELTLAQKTDLIINELVSVITSIKDGYLIGKIHCVENIDFAVGKHEFSVEDLGDRMAVEGKVVFDEVLVHLSYAKPNANILTKNINAITLKNIDIAVSFGLLKKELDTIDTSTTKNNRINNSIRERISVYAQSKICHLIASSQFSGNLTVSELNEMHRDVEYMIKKFGMTYTTKEIISYLLLFVTPELKWVFDEKVQFFISKQSFDITGYEGNAIDYIYTELPLKTIKDIFNLCFVHDGDYDTDFLFDDDDNDDDDIPPQEQLFDYENEVGMRPKEMMFWKNFAQIISWIRID